MSDYDRYVTVRLDVTHVEHLRGDSCKAGAMKPCGFSEGIMARVHDAVRREVTKPPDTKRLREAVQEISEYWNRDENPAAMSDACWRVIEIAEAALALSAEPVCDVVQEACAKYANGTCMRHFKHNHISGYQAGKFAPAGGSDD